MDEAALLAARIEELEGRFELLLGERRAVGLLRAQGEDPSADYDLANKKYVDAAAAVGVAVYNSSSIPVPNNTWTTLTFDSERRDDAGFHSTTVNPSRLTVPAGCAGWYTIWGGAYWDVVVPSSWFVLRLNGASYVGFKLFTNSALALDMITSLYYLNDADYVDFLVYQSSGVTRSIAVSLGNSPEFRMVRI